MASDSRAILGILYGRAPAQIRSSQKHLYGSICESKLKMVVRLHAFLRVSIVLVVKADSSQKVFVVKSMSIILGKSSENPFDILHH